MKELNETVQHDKLLNFVADMLSVLPSVGVAGRKLMLSVPPRWLDTGCFYVTEQRTEGRPGNTSVFRYPVFRGLIMTNTVAATVRFRELHPHGEGGLWINAKEYESYLSIPIPCSPEEIKPILPYKLRELC